MKSFQEFKEDLSRNVIPLDKKSQENLNKSRKGQIGPGSKGVRQMTFKLEPTNIPMK
jgi:hypothetical protein